MAMDDTHALAAAVITGSNIQLKLKNQTIIAQVISAVINCNHQTGTFSGSINYLIDGEQYVKIEAFYNMWMQGWEPVKPNSYLAYLGGCETNLVDNEA